MVIGLGVLPSLTSRSVLPELPIDVAMLLDVWSAAEVTYAVIVCLNDANSADEWAPAGTSFLVWTTDDAGHEPTTCTAGSQPLWPAGVVPAAKVPWPALGAAFWWHAC